MRSRSVLPLLSLLVAPALARASVVVPLSFDELIVRSERIAVCRVESQVARWTTAHDAIYTDVTLRVLRSAKGAARAGETLVVRREGGVVDGIGMRVVGAPAFAVGEEVVVFLERRGQGIALWTVGMAQGKLRVETVDGRKVARRQTSGLTWLPGAVVPGEPAVVPLDELLADIAARVGEGR